jgi:hypothetical protein
MPENTRRHGQHPKVYFHHCNGDNELVDTVTSFELSCDIILLFSLFFISIDLLILVDVSCGIYLVLILVQRLWPFVVELCYAAINWCVEVSHVM